MGNLCVYHCFACDSDTLPFYKKKEEDIYWFYNGVSYIPLEELNSLDSGLVKINITYENGELKEFIPESIELTVLNEDTVYCKATDGYATVSTAFNVK